MLLCWTRVSLWLLRLLQLQRLLRFLVGLGYSYLSVVCVLEWICQRLKSQVISVSFSGSLPQFEGLEWFEAPWGNLMVNKTFKLCVNSSDAL